MSLITEDIPLIEIITLYPVLLPFLIKKGICGLHCSPDDTRSIAEAASDKGFTSDELVKLMAELNDRVK